MRKLPVPLESGLLFVGLCVGLAIWQQQRALKQPLRLTEGRLLDVSSGSTPGGMLARLEQEEVPHGVFWLRLYWRFNLPSRTLHSDEYRLLPGMADADLLELWREGEVIQYSLTLVGGWSLHQIRETPAKQGKLEQTLTGLSDDEVTQRLGKPDEVAEGRFFPDTYRYTRDIHDIDVLRKTYQRMQTILAKEWDDRSQDLPYRDVYQALIMASLVGRETGVPGERPQVADVFIRRLQRGMLLQTDPTVIYGIGERYNNKVTRANLREPTPYNTYVMPDVPSTPIVLAGCEAIRIALHPAEGKILYFVTRGGGSHVFSSGLDEYNKAVREYQLKRRSGYRSSPAPITPPSR